MEVPLLLCIARVARLDLSFETRDYRYYWSGPANDDDASDTGQTKKAEFTIVNFLSIRILVIEIKGF